MINLLIKYEFLFQEQLLSQSGRVLIFCLKVIKYKTVAFLFT